jgi:membrane associated rhomboid family serine protease
MFQDYYYAVQNRRLHLFFCGIDFQYRRYIIIIIIIIIIIFVTELVLVKDYKPVSMYVLRNTWNFFRSWKINEWYTTWVYIFVALGIQHALHLNDIFCGLTGFTVLVHIIS